MALHRTFYLTYILIYWWSSGRGERISQCPVGKMCSWWSLSFVCDFNVCIGRCLDLDDIDVIGCSDGPRNSRGYFESVGPGWLGKQDIWTFAGSEFNWISYWLICGSSLFKPGTFLWLRLGWIIVACMLLCMWPFVTPKWFHTVADIWNIGNRLWMLETKHMVFKHHYKILQTYVERHPRSSLDSLQQALFHAHGDSWIDRTKFKPSDRLRSLRHFYYPTGAPERTTKLEIYKC